MVDRTLLMAFVAFREGWIAEWALQDVLRSYEDSTEEEIDSFGRKLKRLVSLSDHQWDRLEEVVDTHLDRHSGNMEACLRDLAPSDSILEQVEELMGEATISTAVLPPEYRPIPPARPTTPPGRGEEARFPPGDASDTSFVMAEDETIAPTSAPPQLSKLPESERETKSSAAEGGAGRYLLKKRIAGGGLGEIFEAIDSELDRTVVVKKIKGNLSGASELREQFEREAKITGELVHPGIVPVYGLGLDERGRPFYAMRLIEGESLKANAILFHHTEKTDETLTVGARAIRLRAMLSRFITVCNAIQYAHSRGYIHRDLKPENIMLGKYGETLVVDWGLAKKIPPPSLKPPRVIPDPLPEPEARGDDCTVYRSDVTIARPTPEQEAETLLGGNLPGIEGAKPGESAEKRKGDATTARVHWNARGRLGIIKPGGSRNSNPGRGDEEDETIAGTPAFMSPEQARGDNHLVAEASDIYSLGSTLFFLLSGYSPFENKDGLANLLRRVIHGEFPRPRELNPRIPKPLEAICLKAMANDPDERYSSARAISDDIERWLADEPVTAYREPWYVKAARHVRKHKTAYFSGAAAILVALIIGGASSWMIRGQRLVAKAREQIRLLMETNEPGSVVQLIGEIDASGTLPLVAPELRRVLDEPNRSELARLNAGWALAASDPAPKLSEFLVDRALDEKTPIDYLQPVLSALLRRPGIAEDDRLWRTLSANTADNSRWLRAAAILAASDPGSPNWNLPAAPGSGEDSLARVARLVVRQDPGSVNAWSRLFEGIGGRLALPLQSTFQSARSEPDARSFAITLLLDYSKGHPANLAPILATATREEFARLIGAIHAAKLPESERQELIAGLRGILANGRGARVISRPAPEPSRPAVAAEVLGMIRDAGGAVAEGFALVHAIKPDDLPRLVGALEPAGYRLVRLRPWNDPAGLTKIAAIWHRIDGTSEHRYGLDRAGIEEADRRLQAGGYLPVDLAVDLDSGGEPRYSAVWRRKEDIHPNPGAARIVIESATLGPTAMASPDDAFQVLNGKSDALGDDWEYRTAQQYIRRGDSGTTIHRCSVWFRRGPQGPNGFDWGYSQPQWLAFGSEGLQHHVERDVSLAGPRRVIPFAVDPSEVASSSIDALEALYRAFFLEEDAKAIALASEYEANLQSGSDPRPYLQLRAIAASRLWSESFPEEGPAGIANLERLGSDRGELVAIQALWAFERGDIAGAAWELESEVACRGHDPESCAQAARACFIASGWECFSGEERSALVNLGIRWIEAARERGFGDIDRIARSCGAGLEEYPAFRDWIARSNLDRQFSLVISRREPLIETRHILEDSPEAHLKAGLALSKQGFSPISISGASLSGRNPFASIWMREVLPIRERERIAQEGAQAAIALFHLGQKGDALERLRHSPDPTTRSFLVQGFGSLQVDLALIAGLIAEPGLDPGILQGLLLAIGADLPSAEQLRILQPAALRLFREHPDSGVHSAAEWLLRSWKLDAELAKATRELIDAGPKAGSGWYINREGMTFAIIRNPKPFVLGQTWDDLNQPTSGQITTYPYKCRIPHSYAVATRETTRDLFQEFVAKGAGRKPGNPASSPDLGDPMASIAWLDAAAFCNWISERDGLPRGDWFYERIRPNVAGPQIILPIDADDRTGYRLPTRAELEYACRAGTTTPWFFGESEALARRFIWSIEGAGGPSPVGLKEPNPLGIFDILGNLWEWTATPPTPSNQPIISLSGQAILDTFTKRTYLLNEPRLIYGGSVREPARNIRSSSVINQQYPLQIVGMRVARTWKGE